jgi:mono/diheme cytochrome c family protein
MRIDDRVERRHRRGRGTAMTATRVAALGLCAGLTACIAAAAQTPTGTATAEPRQDYNSGDYLYRVFCASCHGDSGTGNGPVAILLRVRPSDLTAIAARNGGVFPRDRVHAAIDGRRPVTGHGPNDMPIWGDILKATEGRDETTINRRIDALVGYIERWQIKGI